eukprot:COSAG06_NODE_230_length_19685_cov_14.110844_19_plen_117_part_00
MTTTRRSAAQQYGSKKSFFIIQWTFKEAIHFFWSFSQQPDSNPSPIYLTTSRPHLSYRQTGKGAEKGREKSSSNCRFSCLGQQEASLASAAAAAAAAAATSTATTLAASRRCTPPL